MATEVCDVSRTSCLQRNASGYFTLPINSNEIARCVSSLLEGKGYTYISHELTFEHPMTPGSFTFLDADGKQLTEKGKVAAVAICENIDYSIY